MASILIVAINYRPEETGTAPYTGSLAEHFAQQGHRTTVITGFAHYPAWRREREERRWRATETLNGVRVLRRFHYVPRSQSALQRALYESSFVLHGSASRPPRPDAVIGVTPTLGGGILARLFAARARTSYAVIVQDLMGPAARQSGIRGGTRVARITTAIERWSVKHARVVAMASESFRPYLQELGVPPSRLLCLPNWAHVGESTADRAAVRARLGWPLDATIVLHAGNMGLKQGLHQVVAAAARADERGTGIRFVLMGDGNQRAGLERSGEGIASLEFLPLQPESELPGVLAAADVLLVSERATVVDMSLPSKLTTYFAAGKPIVAAVPDSGATAREIDRSQAGVVVPVEAPDALNDAVAALRDDPARAEALGRAGQAYAATMLSPARAFARADELVERMLAG